MVNKLMKTVCHVIAACLVCNLLAAGPAASQIPEEFGTAPTIEIPPAMLAAETKMKQIRAARNVRPSDKSAMEAKYKRLEAEFNAVWTPLQTNYTERVQLPGAHLKQVRELERQLQESDSASSQRQIAELRADYPDRIKALNRIIAHQKEVMDTWCKGKSLTGFLVEAERMLPTTSNAPR